MRSPARLLSTLVVVSAAWLLAWGVDVVQADETPLAPVTPLTPGEAAAQVDRLLQEEVLGEAASRTPLVGDELFLRRVSLDVIGRPPSTREIEQFARDDIPDKRAAAVDRLLRDPAYGRNWARYWSDVIMSRQVDQRAFFVAGSLNSFLTENLNQNTGWNEIATDFITATGDVRENGNTAFFMVQMGQTAEIAAEVSRVFLGIQISCAQCHDHPTDHWTREQFHEFAAFFPRASLRPVFDEERRRLISYEVVSRDQSSGRGFGRFRGSSEHYMPDLENPRSRGKMMQPVFFATEQDFLVGTADERRRGKLAEWLTSPENPWFARAIVNRMWGVLVGEGFYEPLDDLGPDRNCSAPQTIDFLADQFVANSHDLKWLYRTITATDAYQRESRSPRNYEELPFAANTPQRLRANQLYDSLVISLGLGESRGFSRGRGFGGGRFSRRFGLQGEIRNAFGFDPSLPRDEISGSIPQAMLLMNSPSIARAIDGDSRSSALGRLLAENRDNEAAITALYLRTLARQPTEREVETCKKYIQRIGNRAEAIEDIQWSLVNSTEFLHRR